MLLPSNELTPYRLHLLILKASRRNQALWQRSIQRSTLTAWYDVRGELLVMRFSWYEEQVIATGNDAKNGTPKYGKVRIFVDAR